MQPGAAVRIIRDPWFGNIGLVGAIPSEPQVLASGSKARVLTEARGIPLTAMLTRANRHDIAQPLPPADAIPPYLPGMHAPRPDFDGVQYRRLILRTEEIEQATGSRLRIVNLPWLNRVDAAWLKETIGSCRTIITLDNHYVQGGQGEMLGAAIAGLGLEPAARVSRIGVTELPECGTNDEVLAHHGLDIPGLVRQFRAALETAAPPQKKTAPQLARLESLRVTPSTVEG